MEINHLAHIFIYSNPSLCFPQKKNGWMKLSIMRKDRIERKTILRKISIHAKG
jgi:hypothetical protein